MNPPGSGVLRCVFRCEAEQQSTDDTLMRLWRHFRKFGCRFRVGGDFNLTSSNKRSSLVTDRRPERRVAFWWPNLWSSISGQLAVPAAPHTRWRDNDAGQPPFARFWLVSSLRLVRPVWLIPWFDRAGWWWSGVSRAASAVHTLSSRLGAGLRCVFNLAKLFLSDESAAMSAMVQVYGNVVTCGCVSKQPSCD